MRVRWRRLLIPAVLEAVLLTLGVALALAAEQWRETRKEREQAELASAAITEEIRANQAAVQQAASYHGALLDSLAARPATAGPPGAGFFRRGFVAPAPVASAAWQTAAETGALEHLPHPLVLRVSQTYGLQGRYERQAEAVGSLIYAELYRGGADDIAANHRNLSHLIGAFAYREQQLLMQYESALAALASRPAR